MIRYHCSPRLQTLTPTGSDVTLCVLIRHAVGKISGNLEAMVSWGSTVASLKLKQGTVSTRDSAKLNCA